MPLIGTIYLEMVYGRNFTVHLVLKEGIAATPLKELAPLFTSIAVANQFTPGRLPVKMQAQEHGVVC